jgi:hypothetical protein
MEPFLPATPGGKPEFFAHLDGNLGLMDIARAAQLQVLLEGIPLPAEKAELLEYAVRQHAEPQLIADLRKVPDRRYESLDEVGEALVRVQPPRGNGPVTPEPREESGDPPGGDAYTAES